MAENKTKFVCSKCGGTLGPTNFFTYKDGTKCELCKKCLTMHVDNFDESTFLWILEKFDVPYIPFEWNRLRDAAYARNPNLTGLSVMGKYLSKMKLVQFKDYGWKDSEKLQRQSEAQQARSQGAYPALDPDFEAEVKAKYDAGTITKAEYETLTSTKTLHSNESQIISPVPAEQDNPFKEIPFLQEDDLPDPAEGLSEEDMLYLAMKWGRLYKPNEWIDLEKKYQEMISSFDIQDSDTISALILICKTNLKMNQAIDCGDMDGFQKLSKVYDTLRKSAKFTAAQNKQEKDDYVDSVGELVAMCERQGFIPRYATDIPQDKVDLTLKDMNDYVYKLVTQDLGFGHQIEDALQKIQTQKEIEETMGDDDVELEDADLIEYHEAIQAQIEADEQEEE